MVPLKEIRRDMRCIANRILLSAIAFFLASLALACRAKPQPVIGPVGPAIPEELIQEYVSQGDESSQAMHLYAWRRAEAAYTQALHLAARKEIRDKLALIKLLRMTREIDEDIACPTMREDIAFICQDTADARGQALCDLATAYGMTPVAAVEQMKRVDPLVLQVDTSPLDAYFFMLYARTFGSDPKNDDLKKRLPEKYKDTPLFAYLNFGSPKAPLARIIEQSPDFAEALEFSAESDFQRNLVKPARTGFSKALSLIPDYTRAINGLANIYFFTLEDYESALKTYEAALQWDPQNTAALFGQGAALHNLDRYQDSNKALDLMLASDLSRNGRVGANSIQYYRGEAYYYKAYNYDSMKDPARARELIDLAKHELPLEGEINYLSGLLYFNAGQLVAAKADFQKVLRSGKNCYAYYYLGMIDLKQGGPTTAAMFLSSSSCLETSLSSYQARIRSLSRLDIEPSEKQALQLRMEMKLIGYRDSSAGLIQHMIGLIRESSIELKWKQTFMDSMNDLLAKVQSISVK